MDDEFDDFSGEEDYMTIYKKLDEQDMIDHPEKYEGKIHKIKVWSFPDDASYQKFLTGVE